MHVNLYKHIEKKCCWTFVSIIHWGVTEPQIVHFIDQNNAPFSRKRKVGKITLSIAKRPLPVTVYAGINIPELQKYQYLW